MKPIYANLAGDIAVLAFLAGALFGVTLTWGNPENATVLLTLFGLLFLTTATGTVARLYRARKTPDEPRRGDADSIVAALEELRGPRDYPAHVISCEDCGDRWCTLHEEHWAECSCPGPHGG